jgi:hypothetical protein
MREDLQVRMQAAGSAYYARCAGNSSGCCEDHKSKLEGTDGMHSKSAISSSGFWHVKLFDTSSRSVGSVGSWPLTTSSHVQIRWTVRLKLSSIPQATKFHWQLAVWC